MSAWSNHWPTLSAPIDAPALRVLSLGAGVQSTTLALAAARGDVGPMPDCAIFADTGWEPRRVYEHLAWLRERLPFPVHIVSAGSLRDSILDLNEHDKRAASVPFFVKRSDGSVGMGQRRQCTREYKIDPIIKEVRRLIGVQPGQRVRNGVHVEQWIGISTDEIQRVKLAQHHYITHRWPLIEANMSRRDCLKWLSERQYSAPKSSCLGCPFHSNTARPCPSRTVEVRNV